MFIKLGEPAVGAESQDGFPPPPPARRTLRCSSSSGSRRWGRKAILASTSPARCGCPAQVRQQGWQAGGEVRQVLLLARSLWHACGRLDELGARWERPVVALPRVGSGGR